MNTPPRGRGARTHAALLRASCTAALLLAHATTLVAQDDVKVSALLTATRIGAGESTVLQISIETQGEGPDAIEMPELPPGLEVTGSQDFSQLQVAFPGGRSRLIRRDLIVRAHVPGEYIIPVVTVTVARVAYRTKPLTLVVDPRRRAGSRPPPLSDGAEVALRAWLEPDTVYVGEQVLFNAEAIFPRDLRQRQSRPASYEAPTPADFWIQDLPEAVSAGIRSIDGAVHETQTFRRAYFPLQPGRYTFPPARLVYEIRRGFLYAPESRELVSDSMSVTVLPIPQQGRPDSFAGAVGRYTVAARLEPETVAAGEAATLTVEVEGTGNVKALPPPRLAELRGVEVYPPSEESRLQPVDDRVGGFKRFTWVLVPEATGRVELPPLEYAFFDPERRTFEVARAEAMTLRVTPPQHARATRAFADTALRALVPVPASPRLRWAHSPLFATLQLIPLIILVGVVLIRRDTAPGGRRSRRRLRDEREVSFAGLRRAASSAESDRVFFGDLAAVLRGALADALERQDLRAASRDTIARLLHDEGVPAESIAALEDLFARIDRARFASAAASAADRGALVTDAKRIVDRIDAAVAPRPARQHTAASIAVLCLLLPAALHGQGAAEFRVGVAAFENRQYTEAVRAFSQHLQHNSDDADAWYNLGNSYMRTGRRGLAVWAWLHAADLDPRRADVRHNLAAAGADDALDALPHSLTVSADEAVVGIAVLWWIAGLTTAVLIAARRRGSAYVVGAATAAALVIAAFTLPPLLRGPSAVALHERTPLLADPTLKSEQLAAIPDGTPVTILGRRGSWLRVESADGREGWVEAQLFGEI